MKENSINTSAVPSWAHTRLGRAGRKSASSEVPGTLLLDFQRIRNQQRALGQYFSNFGIFPAEGQLTIRVNEMDLIASPGCGHSLEFLFRAARCVTFVVGMGVSRNSMGSYAFSFSPKMFVHQLSILAFLDAKYRCCRICIIQMLSILLQVILKQYLTYITLLKQIVIFLTNKDISKKYGTENKHGYDLHADISPTSTVILFLYIASIKKKLISGY